MGWTHQNPAAAWQAGGPAAKGGVPAGDIHSHPPVLHEGTSGQPPQHPDMPACAGGCARSLLADEVRVERDEATVNLQQAPQHEERPAQVVLALRPVAVHCDVQAVPELQPAAGSGGGRPGVPNPRCRSYRVQDVEVPPALGGEAGVGVGDLLQQRGAGNDEGGEEGVEAVLQRRALHHTLPVSAHARPRTPRSIPRTRAAPSRPTWPAWDDRSRRRKAASAQ